MSNGEKQDSTSESVHVVQSCDGSFIRERESALGADNKLLAKLGYKSEFKREFSVSASFNISLVSVRQNFC